MAFGTARVILRTTTNPRKEFYVKLRSPVEIQFITKGAGDTDMTLTATRLRMIREVSVYDLNTGLLIYKEKDTLSGNVTSGFGSNAVVLANLGANTVGLLFVILGTPLNK